MIKLFNTRTKLPIVNSDYAHYLDVLHQPLNPPCVAGKKTTRKFKEFRKGEKQEKQTWGVIYLLFILW